VKLRFVRQSWSSLGWVRWPLGAAGIVYFSLAVWVYFATLEKLGFWEIIQQ
jgi:hypothetical protein